MLFISCIIVAFALGYFTCSIALRLRQSSVQNIANDIVQDAERHADSLRQQARENIQAREIDLIKRVHDTELALQRQKQETIDILKDKQERIDKEKQLLESKHNELNKKAKVLAQKEKEIDKALHEHQLILAQSKKSLEEISGMTREQAILALKHKCSQEVKEWEQKHLFRTIQEAQKNAENQAQNIITTTLSRLSCNVYRDDQTAVCLVPNDETKAKIIGKDGRNIRAFEQKTGVSVLIDELPNAIVLSCFDPVRRCIAKDAMATLIKEGKISPSRIEETVEKAKNSLDERLHHFGQEAAHIANVTHLHPDIIQTLGKLKLRTSYGQNVLDHSVEVSQIMAMIAKELKLDSIKAKRIGLLHDIGKALPSQWGDSHALAGYNFALECNESIDVASGIGCHHDEMEPTCPEASLCKIADALSASRPGARSESIEKSMHRLHEIEHIAMQCEGVKNAYAVHSGRELRIIVRPEIISEEHAPILAKEIAAKLTRNRNSHGKIQVTIIREASSVELTI